MSERMSVTFWGVSCVEFTSNLSSVKLLFKSIGVLSYSISPLLGRWKRAVVH